MVRKLKSNFEGNRQIAMEIMKFVLLEVKVVVTRVGCYFEGNGSGNVLV
jgi:hypothetical protein